MRPRSATTRRPPPTSTAKKAALNKALDAQTEALRNLAEAPPDTSPSERAALQAAVRAAGDDVSVAQSDVNAANVSVSATRETGQRRGRAGTRRAPARPAGPAERTPPGRAGQRAAAGARAPNDNSLKQLVVQAAAKEARSTQQDVSRLARRIGVSVPADEVLFFNTLPLRIDSVRVRRGDVVNGRVMTVSNSRLAIDSSLSITDAKLVRPGAPVEIEEPDLGIKTTGVVTQVADAPGTHKVEQGRVYLAITPKSAPAQLVGASVKLTIAVKSTQQAVLTVPITALTVGADGNSACRCSAAAAAANTSRRAGPGGPGPRRGPPVKGALAPGTW